MTMKLSQVPTHAGFLWRECAFLAVFGREIWGMLVAPGGTTASKWDWGGDSGPL